MQSTFFIGGWLFFAATGSGPMPLQDSLAELARDHAQSVTLIVTLIATILSITSGLLVYRPAYARLSGLTTSST